MRTLRTKKVMAAKVLGVGINKVWFDPQRLTEIKEAITKQDISIKKAGTINYYSSVILFDTKMLI